MEHFNSDMKNILLLIMLILPFSVMAQDDMYGTSYHPKAKINYDKVDSDGSREICSRYKFFAKMSDEGRIAYAISQNVVMNDTLTNLEVYIVSPFKLMVRTGMKFLLKTRKGTTFMLMCNENDEDPISDLSDTYKLNISYRIPKDKIEIIREEGLAKVRIETGVRNFDKEYKNNVAGEYITACFDLVSSEMRKPKSFTDGF